MDSFSREYCDEIVKHFGHYKKESFLVHRERI